MNELCIVKTLQKRSIRVAVFSVILVGIMMVFVVPTLIEEAQARTTAIATSSVGPFSEVRGTTVAGSFSKNPSGIGSTINWQTTGSYELGVVSAKVAGHDVYFVFNNPSISASNTCQAAVTPPGPMQAGCHIPAGGNVITVTFWVISKTSENDNSFCDILNKFDRKYTEVIRNKLGC